MYAVNKDEIKQIIDNHLISTKPFVIKNVPAREKKKYILICMIIHFFKKGYNYTEKEVNYILEPMTEHYVDLRRYLIEYKFLDRKSDGSSYWVIVNHDDYIDYKII